MIMENAAQKMDTFEGLHELVHELDECLKRGEIDLVEFFCELQVIMDRAEWLLQNGE